jgi:cytochrome c-type biogenesis protein CcmF
MERTMIKALLGNLSLICAFVANSSTIYFSFWTYKKEIHNYYLLLILTNLQFIFGLGALFCLSYGYITSDFTILNVYNNSSTIQPLIFKIAAMWSNHEGSILLWAFLLILNTLVFATSSSAPINYKSLTIFIQSIINGCFLGFIIFTSNPFTINNSFKSEGIGLNPLLQDYTLIIHPPILYIAYSAASIIFSLNIAGCIIKTQARLMAYITSKWAIFTFIMLTIGITLGSWWAYRELGWGGYWFWDPVENSSLLPWLISLALIHVIKVTIKKNRLSSWYIGFSLSLFCSSIIATLIVRSGVISSVHSFASDEARGIYILIFLGCLLAISIVSLILRSRNKITYISFISKETAFLLLFAFVITLFFTILLTLITPLLTELFFNYKITIGEPYFNKTFVPIAILGLCCAAIFSFLSWSKSKKTYYKNFTIAIIVATILLSYLKFYYRLKDFMHLVYLFVGLFLIICSSLILFAKNNFKNISMIGAHVSIAIMVIGMTLTSALSEELTKKLTPGEKFTFANYSLTLTNIKLDKSDNFVAITTPIYIEKYSNEIGTLAPEIRYFILTNTTTTESAIYSSILEDLYITIHEVIDQQNVTIKIQSKPFLAFIWFGAIMLVSFTILALFRKNYAT